jgi:CRISPR-associated protein Cmr6
VRPLFQAAIAEPTSRLAQGNAGLWFDKFCNTWPLERTTSPSGPCWSLAVGDGPNPKQQWIGTVTDSPVGMRDELLEAGLRHLRLVEARGGHVAVFKTQSRFASGLGRSHPVGNGLAWHPSLGVPYLPGSSVKGMVRAWAEEAGVDSGDLDRVFGVAGRVGSVCFLDAIPVEPVQLEADVMTPHYAGWDDSNPPGDWRSPTPIPFLVTAAGTPFLFGVVPCVDTAPSDVHITIRLLAEALEFAGAGAKTAVGYGRMERDSETLRRLHDRRTEQDEERREQARIANLTPLDRELEELAAGNKGQSVYITWLQAVEKGRWANDPASRIAVLTRVKEEMQRAKAWKPRSNAKRPDKDRDYQRTRRVLQLIEIGAQT